VLRAADIVGCVKPLRHFGVIAVTLVSCVGAAGCAAETQVGVSQSSGVAAETGLVSPDVFARRVADPAVVTINVHVPNEGDIAGTDLEVPFDQISGSKKLPADLKTPLAVYCRSGNMSALAVKDLKAKGYTSVIELAGGYDAWRRSGRGLEPPAP